MDLNELFSRYQVAMMGMVHGVSRSARACSELRANDLADRIETLRGQLGTSHSVVNHQMLKRIVRG